MSLCPACNTALARVNGRTVRDALRKGAPGHPWSARVMQVKQWFDFCGTCDEAQLRAISPELPYLASDGVMRTLSDRPDSPTVVLGILRTSVDALYCSIAKSYSDDPETAAMELRGKTYRTLGSPTLDEALAFSRAVCYWGGGARVFGNLKRHNPGEQLARQVHVWLSSVPFLDQREALTRGLEIKGLDVSFASKHLRHLEPERFAVLDEVLSLGLGYAMNPAGYQLFMSHLCDLRDQLLAMGEPARTVAQIEAGIFQLARQQVRSDEELVKPKKRKQKTG